LVFKAILKYKRSYSIRSGATNMAGRIGAALTARFV